MFFRNVEDRSLSGEDLLRGYLAENQGGSIWLVCKQCLIHLRWHIPPPILLYHTTSGDTCNSPLASGTHQSLLWLFPGCTKKNHTQSGGFLNQLSWWFSCFTPNLGQSLIAQHGDAHRRNIFLGSQLHQLPLLSLSLWLGGSSGHTIKGSAKVGQEREGGGGLWAGKQLALQPA